MKKMIALMGVALSCFNLFAIVASYCANGAGYGDEGDASRVKAMAEDKRQSIDDIVFVESFVDRSKDIRYSVDEENGTAMVVKSPTASGDILIPASVEIDGVTYAVQEISDAAFSCNTAITGVEISEGIKLIGLRAFESCRGLTSLKLPKSLMSIGGDAFSGCSGVSVYIEDISKWCEIDFGNPSANPINWESRLYCNDDLVANLTIPEGVVGISDFAFYNYDYLESVTIPNSVTNIGEKVFSECSYLGSVRVGTGLLHVGASAFSNYRGCNRSYSIQRRRVYISDVGKWCGIAFGDSTANPLCIDGENRQSILFVDDVEVSDLVIPSGVKHIGDYTFHYVYGLKSVAIPSTVESVGVDAFYAWREVSLQSVYIEDLGKWASIRFASSTANPLYYAKHLILNGGELTVLNIPVGTTIISNSAFVNCESVTSVTIPNTVTNVGSYAFSGCSKLAMISIPSSVKHFGAKPFTGTAYWDSLKDGFVVANGSLIGYKGDCPSDLTIPAGVESICEGAFNGCAVTSVVFPNTLTRIEGKAFCDCPISTLKLPSGIKYIGKEAFSGQNIYRSSSRENFGSMSSVVVSNVSDLVIDEMAFYGQPVSTVLISGLNIEIGKRAFYQTYDLNGKERNYGDVRLTGSGIAVGEEAFAKMLFRKMYVDLSGVQEVSDHSFYALGLYYRSQSSDWYEPGDVILVFSEELTRLSVNAFERACLGRIHVDRIETMFAVDNWLATMPFSCYYHDIRIGGGGGVWGDPWTYDGVSSVTEFVFSNGVTRVPQRAFRNMKVTSVVFPATVTEIGDEAFAYSAYLSNMMFFGDAPVVGNNVFRQLGDPPWGYPKVFENCKVTVIEGSKGWDDDGDGKWQGFTLNYIPMPTYNISYVCAEGVENPNATAYQPTDEIVFEPLADKQDARFVGWEPSRIPLGSIGDVRVEAIWERKTVSEVLAGVELIGSDTVAPWTTEWTGDAWVLRSGTIGNDLASVLAAKVCGPGTLSYRWKVNSETVEVHGQLIVCDKATFSCEGGQSNIYGNTDWTQFAVELQDGEHELVWSFIKDSADDGWVGEDCVWLRDVVWTPSAAFSSAESVAEAFGGDSEIARCVANATQLAAFNAFLADCGIISASSITLSQKQFVYQSFKLSEIMVAPQLFKEEPVLKIDDIELSGGNLSLTILLTAGAEAIQLAKDKLAEKICVGTTLDNITGKPDIIASPMADGTSLTFTIIPPKGKQGFVKVQID